MANISYKKITPEKTSVTSLRNGTFFKYGDTNNNTYLKTQLGNYVRLHDGWEISASEAESIFNAMDVIPLKPGTEFTITV